MNDMTGCQHIRQLLGVYVLGAIDPAERAQVDAHLPGCAECREELAGLAGLPALLGRVPLDEAARIAGFDSGRLPQGDQRSAGLAGTEDTADVVSLAPLLDRMAQRRRMNRWRGLAGVAAVALIAAGAAIGGIKLTDGSSTPTAGGQYPQSVQVTNSASHAKVVVRYASMPWGTSLDTEVYGIPAGTTCEFWVLGSDGRRWQAGGWKVASTWHGTWYPGSSSVPASAVRGFEVTSGAKVLVHLNAT
ncbi:MAG: anti-sigma factor family protein [Streptosporangiaceae bacterium]